MPKITYVELGAEKVLALQTVPENTPFKDAVEKLLPAEKFPLVNVYKFATRVDARECEDLVTKDCHLLALSNVVRASLYMEPTRKTVTVSAKPTARVCDLARYFMNVHMKKGERIRDMYDPMYGAYRSPLRIKSPLNSLSHADFRVCMDSFDVSCMCDVLSGWPYKVTSIENVSSDIFLVKTDKEQGVRDYLVFTGNRLPIAVRKPENSDD